MHGVKVIGLGVFFKKRNKKNRGFSLMANVLFRHASAPVPDYVSNADEPEYDRHEPANIREQGRDAGDIDDRQDAQT